jgi:hypothetical protein
MIREKNKKIRIKVDIKNRILRDVIEKKQFKTKYTTIKRLMIKFDIINK